jgi:putative spermidine/putrescine transport system permease protein
MAGKRRPLIALMLAPALLVLGGLFGAGMMAGIWRTLDAGLWWGVLTDGRVWAGLGVSLWIAGAATVLSGLIAVPMALGLRHMGAAARLMFQVNLTVPHLVGALGVLFLLGQSGLVARTAFHMGLLDAPAQFPALVFDRAGVGIVLSYVWKEVPFLGLIVLAALQSIDRDFDSVARSLGATRVQSLRHVTLPLVWPALARGMILVFAFTFGAYEVPALLGQTYPQALPVLAWRTFTDVDLHTRPQAMAMALLIAVVSFALIAVYRRVAR